MKKAQSVFTTQEDALKAEMFDCYEAISPTALVKYQQIRNLMFHGIESLGRTLAEQAHIKQHNDEWLDEYLSQRESPKD